MYESSVQSIWDTNQQLFVGPSVQLEDMTLLPFITWRQAKHGLVPFLFPSQQHLVSSCPCLRFYPVCDFLSLPCASVSSLLINNVGAKCRGEKRHNWRFTVGFRPLHVGSMLYHLVIATSKVVYMTVSQITTSSSLILDSMIKCLKAININIR